MIEIRELQTECSEEDLFVKLASRGRHANIPYYLSVEDSDWKTGCVTFIRLDCEPAPGFKVVVSGPSLLVSVKDIHHVEEWLREWGLSHKVVARHTFKSPEKVWEYIKKHRQRTRRGNNRKEAGKRVAQSIRKIRREEDWFLMMMD